MPEPMIWTGSYEKGWGKFLPSDAYAHPAKIAHGLAERIYAHLLERGYVRPGDVVLDPFAGIGGFAFGAMNASLRFLGAELESKFCGMANGWECPGNEGSETDWPVCRGCIRARKRGVIEKPHHVEGTLEFWRRRWGLEGATIIQGDSRKLVALVGPVLAECVVGSPPFQESINDGADHGRMQERYPGWGKNLDGSNRMAQSVGTNYGQTPGQLGAMPAGSIDDVISSPPYAETLKGDGSQAETAEESRAKRRTEGGSLGQSQRTQGYGSTGNLGNLPVGEPPRADAVVGSPPFGAELGGSHKTNVNYSYGSMGKDYVKPSRSGVGCRREESPANLGTMQMVDGRWAGFGVALRHARKKAGLSQCDVMERLWGKRLAGGGAVWFESGTRQPTDEEFTRLCQILPQLESFSPVGTVNQETFWSAAREILLQCHAILHPGAVAVWVVKAFVRNKALVDFPGQWRRLCEACGFVMVEEIHASLVKERRDAGLFGEEVVKKKKRMSFFRCSYEIQAAARKWWDSGALTAEQQTACIAKADLALWGAFGLLAAAGAPTGKRPTPAKVKLKAQVDAYKAAKCPPIEIATRIDHEVVLILRKPEGAAVGPVQVAAVVGSPPYAEGLGHGGEPTIGGGKMGDVVLDAMQQGYGTTPGQLAAMPAGSIEEAIALQNPALLLS